MIETGPKARGDDVIDRRIDELAVHAAHRETARLHYRHAMATADNLAGIVETLERIAGSWRQAHFRRSRSGAQ
jgi:hypothetical protein